MTDEQLVAYVDAAEDRITDMATAEFDAMVSATRAGTIFAHDQRAWTRWQSRRQARQATRGGTVRGLTGAALERAVRGLASRNPEYVVMGAA